MAAVFPDMGLVVRVINPLGVREASAGLGVKAQPVLEGNHGKHAFLSQDLFQFIQALLFGGVIERFLLVLRLERDALELFPEPDAERPAI